MLEIRSGRGDGANGRGVKGATAYCEQEDGGDAALHLEPPRIDVLVGNQVGEQVQDRTQQGRAQPRAGKGAACRSGSDVNRDDHTPRGRYLARLAVRPEVVAGAKSIRETSRAGWRDGT